MALGRAAQWLAAGWVSREAPAPAFPRPDGIQSAGGWRCPGYALYRPVYFFVSVTLPMVGHASRFPVLRAGGHPTSAGVSQRSRPCFAQHVQYNLYLFLSWCRLSNDLLNKAIMGFSQAGWQRAADKARSPLSGHGDPHQPMPCRTCWWRLY